MLMISSGVAGLGAASAAITSLQQALVGLAQASGRPAIHPGPVDGILGNMTMNAVAAGLQAAAAKIPQDTTMKVVSLALALGATTSQAKTAVTSYASQLTILIKTATAAYATGLIKPSPTPPSPPPTMISPQMVYMPGVGPGAFVPGVGPITAPMAAQVKPWYTQWWGIAAIAAGAFGVYLVLAPKKTTAAAAGA